MTQAAFLGGWQFGLLPGHSFLVTMVAGHRWKEIRNPIARQCLHIPLNPTYFTLSSQFAQCASSRSELPCLPSAPTSFGLISTLQVVLGRQLSPGMHEGRLWHCANSSVFIVTIRTVVQQWSVHPWQLGVWINHNLESPVTWALGTCGNSLFFFFITLWHELGPSCQ